jgi:hypothetical protein
MRYFIAAAVALPLCACASYDPTRYDEREFETASSANPIDRGTEMIRQVRNAEIQRDKQLADEKKKTPRLFKSQEDDEDAGDQP